MEDISAVVVALVLIALFFGGVLWLEIHSRSANSKEPGPNASKQIAHEEDAI